MDLVDVQLSKSALSKLRVAEARKYELETQNSMLFLKLAKVQGELRQKKKENALLKKDLENQSSTTLIQLQKLEMNYRQTIKHLRSDLDAIKQSLSKLGVLFATSLKEVTTATSQLPKFDLAPKEGLEERIDYLEKTCDELMAKHLQEKQRRKELHNTLMELRGNIRVHCRVRPLMPFDCGTQQDKTLLGSPGTISEPIVHVADEEIVHLKFGKTSRTYEFERVFNEDESQDIVFDDVLPMIESLLDGYNVCIMAYGQTGSGKTHTMLGDHAYGTESFTTSVTPSSHEGIVPRATRELFRLIEEKSDVKHEVEISVVEIYNNEIRDLLGSDPRQRNDLVTGADGSVQMPSVTCRPVSCMLEVMTFVKYGLEARSQTTTLIHDHSSRSHLIVILNVTMYAPSLITFKNITFSNGSRPSSNMSTFSDVNYDSPRSLSLRSRTPSPSTLTRNMSNTGNRCVMGGSLHNLTGSQQQLNEDSLKSSSSESNLIPIQMKLQLVDLAGSECVAMSGVKGNHLRETCEINKSLSALADVLGALAEHRPHVPYRNTKLTHLLQHSIGGDAKLLLMLCVSPARRYHSETLQCLNFGQRARQVHRGPAHRRLPIQYPSSSLSMSNNYNQHQSRATGSIKYSKIGNSPRSLSSSGYASALISPKSPVSSPKKLLSASLTGGGSLRHHNWTDMK